MKYLLFIGLYERIYWWIHLWLALNKVDLILLLLILTTLQLLIALCCLKVCNSFIDVWLWKNIRLDFLLSSILTYLIIRLLAIDYHIWSQGRLNRLTSRLIKRICLTNSLIDHLLLNLSWFLKILWEFCYLWLHRINFQRRIHFSLLICCTI